MRFRQRFGLRFLISSLASVAAYSMRVRSARRVSMMALAAITFVSLSSEAQLDEMTTVTVEGSSKAVSAPEASRAIVQNLQQSVARQSIIDMIGEKAYQKNKQLIEARIVRESYKFIPFVTPGTPVKAADGWRMPVTMQVALGSLRQMVIANGLLFDIEGPAALLPMVVMNDRVRQFQYRWWMMGKEESGHKLLHQLNQNLHQALFDEMNRRGFYVIRPKTPLLAGALPESLRGERLRPEDLRFLGQFYGAQMVVRGDVRLRESSEIIGGFQISIKLQAVQTANGRSVAEVARTFETEPGAIEGVVRTRLATALPEVAKDLAVQVTDAWQKGTLGSNLVRLSLRGRLSPRQVTEFKASVMKTVREVKSVRERVIEPGGITFEVDYNGGAQQFADRFKSISIPGFAVRMASADESGVVMDVRAQ